MNVYAKAEAMIRARAATRRNLEACVTLGLWVLRTHGPYEGMRAGEGRQFRLARIGLSQDDRFSTRAGLTSAQIRGAIAVLMEIGLLVVIQESQRLSLGRNWVRNTPTMYGIGTEFANLFPVARERPSRVQNLAPLYLASRKNPVPQPARLVEWPRDDAKRLMLAKIANVMATPLQPLSAGAWKTLPMQRMRL